MRMAVCSRLEASRISVRDAGIGAVRAVFFFSGQFGLRAIGSVFGKPAVPCKPECLRGRHGADIDFDRNLRAIKHNGIVLDEHVATRNKTLVCGLLKYAENPLFRERELYCR